MENYIKQVEIRWSDLDPNFHVRHSAYYDMGAYVRMSFLTEHGLGAPVMLQYNIGPILFREECLFKREIHFGDHVTVNLVLKHFPPNYSRWTFEHTIIKNYETVAAIITAEGAWIDTTRRRLTVPPDAVHSTFEAMPRGENV